MRDNICFQNIQWCRNGGGPIIIREILGYKEGMAKAFWCGWWMPSTAFLQ